MAVVELDAGDAEPEAASLLASLGDASVGEAAWAGVCRAKEAGEQAEGTDAWAGVTGEEWAEAAGAWPGRPARGPVCTASMEQARGRLGAVQGTDASQQTDTAQRAWVAREPG